jgi:glycosyltransferase involved in cell wall biosynthesis
MKDGKGGMEQHSPFPLDDIWCVIPVYNNKDTLMDVALGCNARIPRVVVVDDGSTDTDVSALFAGSDIEVLRHSVNLGKGRAILTALPFIASRGGRFMITIDADGQHYPRDLERFIPLLQEDEAAVVIGCRMFHEGKVPWKSRFGRKLANFWLWVETGVGIDDCQSGFRAYPVQYLAQIKLTASRYDFETEVLARAVWAGLRLKTVDIDVWYPEPHFRNSSFRPFMDNLRISCMHARLVGRRLLPFPHRRLVTSP